ncbi:hypothetical protein CRH09_25035 [Nocardia terpenica]|uniref:Uncharacterized protein n=2 Tax=Nocardia terpenica TaxID=455432 RepID=A0A291RNS7_9NOCA|nr:hypothetical protein CRH09_25035 [Nocardia terpenica]
MMVHATGRAPSEAAEELSRLDARLLTLDLDLEELFAEIEEVLCEVRDRWGSLPVREHRMPWPGAR